MKVSIGVDKHEMTLKEIENFIRVQQQQYPNHDLEIIAEAEDGRIYVWLDDHDREIDVLDIIPTKNELELLYDHKICGKSIEYYAECIGHPKYDWNLHREVCSKCKKCLKSFNFQEE